MTDVREFMERSRHKVMSRLLKATIEENVMMFVKADFEKYVFLLRITFILTYFFLSLEIALQPAQYNSSDSTISKPTD